MEKNLLKSLILVLMLLACPTNAMSQSLFKKLKQAAGEVMTNSKEQPTLETSSDTISTESLLKDVPSFIIKKVIETDEKGDTITNEDGTIKYHYLVIDKEGKVCAANTARKIVNARLKSIGIVLAKTLAGAGVGATVGKNKKERLIGGIVGGLVGLAASSNNIEDIKKQNGLLKDYKKTLEVYQKTFTEEGLPIDANIDLANIDGIDFTQCEELTKSAAEVKEELAESISSGESLEDIDLDEIVKS